MPVTKKKDTYVGVFKMSKVPLYCLNTGVFGVIKAAKR
jgi:hypothetical protein